MPLERKILLFILTGLFSVFIVYIGYNRFYLLYVESTSLSDRYIRLINSYSKPAPLITSEDIHIIEDKILDRKSLFFDSGNSIDPDFTSYIKKLLTNSGLSILQYQNTGTAVRFIIDGNKDNLLKFIYSISKEDKYYDFTQFNIRMLDDCRFQGSFEVKKLILTNNIREESYIRSERNQYKIGSLNSSIASILGLSSAVKKKALPEARINNTESKIESNQKLEKFDFVGYLKNGKEELVMFKERYNGRIYKFKQGETLSGWTYLYEEKDKFHFIRDNIKYEVIR
jgi:hypothetical protein